MYVLLLVVIAAVSLHNSKGAWILPEGGEYFAVVGENLTFYCVTANASEGSLRTFKWYFGDDQLKTRCHSENLTSRFPGASSSEKACSVAINPVGLKSSGNYTCEVYDGFTERYNITIRLQVGEPTIELQDLQSQNVVNLSSGPLCIESGTARQFECTVKDTKSGIWNMTWLLEDVEQDSSSVEETTNGSELVHLRTRFRVHNQGNDSREANLTCRATEQKEQLEVTVELQFCSDSEYETMLLRFFMGVSITAAILAIIGHILIWKYM